MGSKKTALIFPGLGVQHPGMLSEFYGFDVADEVYTKARGIIGTLPWILSSNKIMQHFSLKRLDYSQLAIFIANHAIYELLMHHLPSLKEEYKAVAGHSLGQCNAIVASGAISFEEALPFVYKISNRTYKFSKKINGGLMCLISKSEVNINPQLEELGKIGIYPALFNAPNQVILGGQTDGIRDAVSKMNFDGIKAFKLRHLNMPYHTRYMKESADSTKEIVYSIDFKYPRVPIYVNSSAKPIFNPQEIYEEITSQIHMPVNWEGTILKMSQDGITRFIVLGPDKKVRTKQAIEMIVPDAEVLVVNNTKSLEEIINNAY